MKKRVLSILLCLCMAVTLLSTMALATDAAIAGNGDSNNDSDLVSSGADFGQTFALQSSEKAGTIAISGDIVCANGIPIVIRENGSITSVYDENGNLLSGETDVKDKQIAGGWQSGDHEGDTSVTVESGTLTGRIYGGNFNGNLTGNTSITVNGGSVGYLFGGNKEYGTVTGDTNITINDGTVTGWVYGGGAGSSSTAITEVTGSTNITINGGELQHNVYGGGGWRGAAVGSANITIKGGTVRGYIYGGGEEKGSTGDVSITVDGNVNIFSIYAGGAGFGSTNATVTGNVNIEIKSGTIGNIFGSGGGDSGQTSTVSGSVAITLSGGSAQYVDAANTLTGKNDGLSISGDLSVTADGGQILQGCYLGDARDTAKAMKNVSLTLKGQTAQSCRVEIPAPITDSLTVVIEDRFQELTMGTDVLKGTKTSSLTYVDCGTAAGTWAAYASKASYPTTKGTNPYTEFGGIKANQFDTLTLRNCYLDYNNRPQMSNEINEIAKKLIVDGGALRVYLGEATSFPATEFQNNPLLLYGYEFKSGYGNSSVVFNSVSGTARLATLAIDGQPTTAAFSSLPNNGLVVAPDTTPKSAFSYVNLRSNEHYLLGTDTYGSPATQTTWKIMTEDNCRCQLSDLRLEETYFYLSSGDSSKTVTMKEYQDGKTNQADNCPIVGHAGKAVAVSYAVANTSDAPGAAMANGNRLTVTGPGVVDVDMTASLNIRQKTKTLRTSFVRLPEQASYIHKTGGTGTISIVLQGSGLSTNLISNTTSDSYLSSSTHYTSAYENGALTVTLNSDYLNSLELGTYTLRLSFQCSGVSSNGAIEFTVTITDKDIPTVSANDITATFTGTALPESAITGSAVFGGQAVPGSWSWKEEAPINVADSGVHTVVFTPTDMSTYAAVEDEITVTINKATPTGTPKYTAITSAGKTLADAGLTTDGSNFSCEGSVKWVDADGNDLPETTAVTANTAYRWLFTPADMDNCNPVSGSATLYSVSTGGSSVPSVAVTVSSNEGTVSVSATVSGGTATVTVTDKQLAAIASNAASIGTVTVDLSGLKNVDSAKIPAKVITAANTATGSEGLEIILPTGTVKLDETALTSVASSNKNVTVSVETVKTSTLTTAQKEALGDKMDSAVVVDINILASGTKVTSFNGGTLTVSVPYTPKTGEDTSKLTVWYIKDDGTIEKMGGHYDSKNKCFVFDTTHLSKYVLVSDTSANPFTDVAADAYYYDAVLWAMSKGVTGGTSATTFAPNVICTRAQTVTFLWRAMGSPEPTTTVNPFTDVSADAYYYKAVLWAAEKGITAGSSATTFSPDATVSRGQVATFLWRAAGKPAASQASSFTDISADAYYSDAVLWAAEKGITGGTSAATFSPDNDCTRSQIVTFLYRYFGK